MHILREAFKNYLADFFRSPPYPLNEKSFCQKTLSGKGGTTPPPPSGKLPKIFLKNGSKRAKIGIFWPKIAVL